MTVRVLGLPNADIPAPYADTESNDVMRLYTAGIMEGSVTNGIRYFKPESFIKRSEISAVVSRIYDYHAAGGGQ